MKQINILVLIICYGFSIISKANINDLYIVGYFKSSDGIGQIGPNLINLFHNTNIKINLIESRSWPIEMTTLTDFHKKLIQGKKNLQLGNFYFSQKNLTILTDTLWTPFWKQLTSIRNNGIKFAISMVEYSIVPKGWGRGN